MIRLNSKAHWREFRNSSASFGRWYMWGDVKACVNQENGWWHISVSVAYRYPTWDEIYTAWYDLVPEAENRNGAIILPKKAEYVNMHPNCFHVHELSSAEITSELVL